MYVRCIYIIWPDRVQVTTSIHPTARTKAVSNFSLTRLSSSTLPHSALVAKSPGKLQGQCNGALNKPRHDQCISATIQAVVPALGREESPSIAPGEDANFAECAGSANRLEQRETLNTCASAVLFLLHVTFCDVGFCPYSRGVSVYTCRHRQDKYRNPSAHARRGLITLHSGLNRRIRSYLGGSVIHWRAEFSCTCHKHPLNFFTDCPICMINTKYE